jgi:hypothetical protein
MLALGVGIIAFLPNTQQIMRSYRPAVNWSTWREVGWPAVVWRWRPTPLKLLYVAFMFFMGVEFIQRGAAVFVYFNF